MRRNTITEVAKLVKKWIADEGWESTLPTTRAPHSVSGCVKGRVGSWLCECCSRCEKDIFFRVTMQRLSFMFSHLAGASGVCIQPLSVWVGVVLRCWQESLSNPVTPPGHWGDAEEAASPIAVGGVCCLICSFQIRCLTCHSLWKSLCLFAFFCLFVSLHLPEQLPSQFPSLIFYSCACRTESSIRGSKACLSQYQVL